MTALLAVYTASLVGSRWGAKSHPQQLYLALLALPLLLSLTLGVAPRFIGLLLGLVLIRLIARLGRGHPAPLQEGRSEERRVGKACRSRLSPSP